MTREQFVSIMESFKRAYDRHEEFCDNLDKLLGTEAAIQVEEHSFLGTIIHVLDLLIDPHVEDIRYLIYECKWDFDSYNAGCVDEEPDVHDFGALYDFIVQEEKEVVECKKMEEQS